MSNWYVIPSNNDILHYGILGMRWGVRRYQNADGSLTSEGRKKYYKGRNITRGIGTVAGNLVGGPILGAILGRAAETHQVKSNIEKDERRIEREEVSKMSDRELNDFNQRKSLERQLSDILSKEREKSGLDYVKDLYSMVIGGANIVKNVTDTAYTLSTPNKQQKKEVMENIKNDEQRVINKLTKERDDKIKEERNKLKGKELENSIKNIKEDYNNKIESTKAEYKKTRNNYSQIAEQQLLATTRNRADNFGQMSRMEINTISDLSKLYNTGKTIDTSELSLPDLQKLVNRARAEQQYLDVVTPTNTSDGYEYVANFLNTTASVTGTASSAVRLMKI